MPFGFVVREVVAAVPGAESAPPHVIYAGDLDEYRGGLGAFDEGDCHIFRWKVNVVNLTPHDIIWVRAYDQITIPKSGFVARVSTKAEPVESAIGVPLVRTAYGQVEGLPGEEKDTVHIVSALVLNALREAGVRRSDVIAPDTGPESVVRDENGQIIGVRRFMTI